MIKCVRVSYVLIVTVCILNIIHGLLFSRGSRSARSGCSSCGSGIAVPVRIVQDSSQKAQPQRKVRRIRRLPTSSCGCNSAAQQTSSGWGSSGCPTAAPQSSCGCQTAPAPVSSCGCSAPAPQIAVPTCVSQPVAQSKGWGSSDQQQQMYVIVEEQNVETMSPVSGWGQSAPVQQGWG